MSETSTVSLKKRKRRINAVSVPAETVIHIIMILFCLFCIIPSVFVVIISFTSEESIRQIGYSFIPNEWSVEGYQYVMKMGAQLWRSYFNSFFITVVGTICSVLMCVLKQKIQKTLHLLLNLPWVIKCWSPGLHRHP